MDNKSFDAVGIGACNLDMVAFVNKFTECEEKINAYDYVEPRAAGVALDAITQIAYLGMRCGFIGKHGDDYLGKIFEEEMKADDIDLSRRMVIPGERTSLAWIQVKPDGERCHVIIPMSEKGQLQPDEMDNYADYLNSARVCHMELLQMPIAPMVRASELCKKSGTLVSIDLDVAPRYLIENQYATQDELNHLLSMADILKVCKNAVPGLSGKNDLSEAAKDILKMGPKLAIITIGEKGCIAAFNDSGKLNALNVPAFTDTGVKDTTGAGDAFQGGFIYGILKGWDIEKASVLANACGYLKSLRVGARNMPEYEVVEQFLQKKGWESIA